MPAQSPSTETTHNARYIDELWLSQHLMDKSTLDFLLVEAEEIRKAKESLRGVLFGVFGAYLPVLVSIFGFAASHDPDLNNRIVAALFIVVASLSAMWVQYLWMEYVCYMRYYYCELLPRIYAATHQGSRRNFLAWTFPRSATQLLPLALFNVGSFVVMIGAYWIYVRGGTAGVEYLCLGFLAASFASVGAVVLEVRALNRKLFESATLDSSDRAESES